MLALSRDPCRSSHLDASATAGAAASAGTTTATTTALLGEASQRADELRRGDVEEVERRHRAKERSRADVMSADARFEYCVETLTIGSHRRYRSRP